MTDILDKYFSVFKCKNGVHEWGSKDKADRCCNGWVRAFRLLSDDRHSGGLKVEAIELIPVDELDFYSKSHRIDMKALKCQSN